MQVDLGRQSSDLSVVTARGEGTDRLFGFEAASGSCFNDRLIGTSGFNILFGGPGSDELFGKAGVDALMGDDDVLGDPASAQSAASAVSGCTGRPGNDLIDGGPDFDFARYDGVSPGFLGRPMSVDVDLRTGRAVGQGVDRLRSVELLNGSNGDDRLIGNGAANTFWPEGGYDVVSGRGGLDTISYSDLDTYLNGRWTAVSVDVDLRPRASESGGSVGIVSLSKPGATHGESDQLDGIEFASGSEGNDVIVGSSGNNFLSGGPGNDQIYGLDGSDVINGGPGANDLDGGADGRDIADYVVTTPDDGFTCVYLSTPSPAYDVCKAPPSTGFSFDANFDPIAIDNLVGFEGVEGSSGQDFLIGDAGVNEVYGLGGDDLLVGKGGSDFLDGGAPDTPPGDALVGNAGFDNCFGGEQNIDCEAAGQRDPHPILSASHIAIAIEVLFDDIRGKKGGF